MKHGFLPAMMPVLWMLALPAHGAAVLDLVPGSHLKDIEQVVYQSGATTITQNTPATGVVQNGDGEMSVKSVRITDGAPVDLTFFNTASAVVVNVNPQYSGIGGVGVFNNGVNTYSTGGLTAYASAYAATVLDTDLRNFTFHDYLSPTPPTTGVPDLDILFYHAMLPEDYFLVAERWGNSSFTVTALKADGTPYAGANVLRLGGPGGTFGVGYEVYDWNTGYAATSNNPTQAQALSLFSVSKFFAGTQVAAGPVYGLRIDNDGEADPKIMGISGNTFSDNPENPQLVPEPASLLITGLGGLLWVCTRRREPRESGIRS